MKHIYIERKTIDYLGVSSDILCLGLKEQENQDYYDETYIYIEDEGRHTPPIATYICEFIEKYSKIAIERSSWSESYDCDCCGGYWDDYFKHTYGEFSLISIIDGHFGNHDNMYLEDEVKEFFENIGFKLYYKEG